MEKVCRFGINQGLSGIFAEPDKRLTATGNPAVILLNAGLTHKVGPFRLNVDLARYLAAQGFYSLRFDLAGLGDSEPRSGRGSDFERAVSDVEVACDYLQSAGIASSFILIGLCSGADLAHRVAFEDQRICGAVFLDGFACPTVAFRFYYHLARLKRWKRFLSRWIRHPLETSPESEKAEVYERNFPTKERFRSDVGTMLERGVRLLYIYSGGYSDCYNHAGQWKRMLAGLPLNGQIESEFFKFADHTYSYCLDRRLLIQRIGEWSSKNFQSAKGTLEFPLGRIRREGVRRGLLVSGRT